MASHGWSGCHAADAGATNAHPPCRSGRFYVAGQIFNEGQEHVALA